MNLSDNLLSDWLPVVITLLFFASLTWLAQVFLFNKLKHTGNENIFARQLVMLLLMLVGLISVVIALPLSENLELQILSLIGLVLSGLLAFSSTTIFGNLVAGAMMRFTQPFRTGDFIRFDDTFGRVTELGLFDCEIQTETRELVSIPNSMLISKAVSVIRRSGTIVSVELSLGYDLHHSRIDELLLQAAKQTGLEEPFVHVTQLGDFSVSYKVSGLLVEIKNLLTARSNLHRNVLDCLHDKDIEIMSPNFISQHAGPDAKRMIAHSPSFKKAVSESNAEDLIFDKAEQAQQLAMDKEQLIQQIEALELQLSSADKDQHEALETRIDQLRVKISEIKKVVDVPEDK
ncbi:MAG: mechanosensitive ion channel family protein [Paraglaciecola sp.]|uniref:mechanosensitive ion channel family protein n=1 Tax=Paraglaciecola sp. TaxID=1920173 RepID=UPI00273E6399|nr:mechanosensitive ion channel domain-containing protein [Paraglaciecola sp.]MDP5029921.1 mechanosensitive ion channel family protein [Paraglaciecola sp.]MDP5133977.1 mechanosensitive ion channel family protein [Paraglaciecola sp.]